MAKRKGDSPKKDINAIIKAIVTNKNKLQTVASNKVKSLIATRVFNFGTATNGSPIGFYKNTYKSGIYKNRQKRKGSQVDLTVSQRLQKSLVSPAKVGDNIVVAMKDQNYTENFSTLENAIAQEKNFKKEIFAPNEKEINAGDRAMKIQFNKIVKQALK